MWCIVLNLSPKENTDAYSLSSGSIFLARGQVYRPSRRTSPQPPNAPRSATNSALANQYILHWRNASAQPQPQSRRVRIPQSGPFWSSEDVHSFSGAGGACLEDRDGREGKEFRR
ncbi:hypothetical protein B0H12DRAFT_1100988 [Mycena haematopus]|nr:hypothetical protein B0H12DRAFT_1100988 [Mycena haematopus]